MHKKKAKEGNLRLRIALHVGSLGLGGAEKQAIYIAKALQQAGVELRVYYNSIQAEVHKIELARMNIDAICLGQNDNSFLRFFRLLLNLISFKPHMLFSTRSYTNIHISIAKYFINTITIGSSRSSLPHDRELSGKLFPHIFTMPDYIIVNSQTTKTQLTETGLASESNIYVLPNVLDLDGFDQQTQKILTHYPILGKSLFFVGRLSSVKRIDNLLHAISLARQSVPQIGLVIVGDGPEQKSIENLIHELKLEPNVTMLGRSDDIPALLKQYAYGLVLTSDEEGFPNVILEAMAAQLPVITTAVGDASFIVKNEWTGYVVSKGDIRELAGKIVYLLRHPQLQEQFGIAGRKKLEERYSYESLSKNLLEIIVQIAKSKNDSKLLELIYQLLV
jgi:glycosyltransferase involved in cell wall biosynthesis